MSLVTPAYSGSESIVGITRESTWGTTPTTGADPNKTITGEVFIPIKEESIEETPLIDPQTDEMVADREIQRSVIGGNTARGNLRLIAGPESIGYFLTMMFGTPTTSTLAATSGSYEAAYQHIWYPGLNTRANWPVPYSIESIFAGVKAKLIQGAIISRLPLDLPNNGPMTITPEFLAKKATWLTSASGETDATGDTTPAKYTAAPTLITEREWRFIDMTAYPQLDNVDQQSLLSNSWELGFVGLEGLFTGGSGRYIGDYRVDNFQATGRATILFEDETLWHKFRQGANFELDITLKGDLIQGAYYNQLQIIAYRCKATDPRTSNQVGNLAYDFGWAAEQDPTEGKSIQVTLVNTVSSYA